MPCPPQNLPQDRVRVQLAPEKAGFILKHVNYIVQSSVCFQWITRAAADSY